MQLEFRAADLAAAADLEDATTSSMQVRLGRSNSGRF